MSAFDLLVDIEKDKNMNSVRVVEPEKLEYLPAATMLKLIERSQKSAKNFKQFKRTIEAFPELFRAFEEYDLSLGFNLDNEYMNLSFAGDGEKLKTVWGVLRRSGYKTLNRPEKGDTTFNAFWTQDGYAEIFMMFSSTLCKRVQIGTKMKEVPIYETQCGDLPEIEADSTEVAITDEMPF